MVAAKRKNMEIPDEIKAAMFQTWLPALTSSLIAGVKELPAKHRNALLTRMCTTCEDMAMAGAVGIQPGMTWEAYVKYVRDAPPPIGPWDIKQNGDTYDLVYTASLGPDGKPRCHCPLLQLGIMDDPMPFCCDSGARLAGKMIAAATGKKVRKVELVDSPSRTSAAVCHYRVCAGADSHSPGCSGCSR
ncbi:MAG: hypothetical protein IBX68_07570 [Dehalococcoidia bacterium]|nr:hypothetical protein [Dehalococcoidia bacterium]